MRFVELLSADEYERRLNMDIFKVHLGREDPGEQFVTMFSPHSGRLCMTALEDAFRCLTWWCNKLSWLQTPAPHPVTSL